MGGRALASVITRLRVVEIGRQSAGIYVGLTARTRWTLFCSSAHELPVQVLGVMY